jgi:hypothetical protein
MVDKSRRHMIFRRGDEVSDPPRILVMNRTEAMQESDSEAARQRQDATANGTLKRRWRKIVLEGPAIWLENSREDSVWILPESNGPRRGKRRTLRFTYRLPDGSLLTDSQNTHLYKVAKEYAVLIREGPFAISDNLAVDTHVTLVNNLLSIIGWMRLHGITAFGALTGSDLENLSSAAAHGVAVQLNAFERLRETLVRLIESGKMRDVVRKNRRGEAIDHSAVVREAGLPDAFCWNTGRIFASLGPAIKAGLASDELIAALCSKATG